MSNGQQWINEAGTFYPVDGDTRLLKSPGDGIFVVVESSNPMMTRIGLRKIGDRFSFDFKIYELGTEPMIRLVKKTWESDIFMNCGKNLGVIFNGIKGTGKTLSAQLLCNAIGLPVVVVQSNLKGLLPFIQSLNFECVIFIDEAEKTFKRDESGDILLRLIDGAFNVCRRLYVLTTNQLTLNENLLGRPGRIRYRFEFNNLQPSAIDEYLKDNLLPKYAEQRKKILEQIDLLEISTIDILKALVDEVNIHGRLPQNACLNVPIAKFAFDILSFYELESYERHAEVMNFIREKLSKFGATSLNEWLKNWKSEDGKMDAEDLLSDEFGFTCETKMTSSSSSLWKDANTSVGTIIREPDTDGFFVVRPFHGDTDRLCLLLRRRESPSLYRGNLF
ncbi:MAG: AAA family ATPase [Bacteroidales bacterium]|nr:AAA family ATPase [Bacteroidales bacterium]